MRFDISSVDFAYSILMDGDPAWRRVRDDAALCLRSVELLAPIYDNSIVDYCSKFSKDVVIAQAKILRQYKRSLFGDAFRARLSEAVSTAESLKKYEPNNRPCSAVAVLSRSCTVCRWLLSLGVRNLESVKVNSRDLAYHLTQLELDPRSATSFAYVVTASKLLNDLQPPSALRRAQKQVTVVLPISTEDVIAEICKHGIRFVRADKALFLKFVQMTRRSMQILASAWHEIQLMPLPYEEAGTDPNKPVFLNFNRDTLSKRLGTSISRTTLSTLRHAVHFGDGSSLISNGNDRISLVPFRIFYPMSEKREFEIFCRDLLIFLEIPITTA